MSLDQWNSIKKDYYDDEEYYLRREVSGDKLILHGRTEFGPIKFTTTHSTIFKWSNSNLARNFLSITIEAKQKKGVNKLSDIEELRISFPGFFTNIDCGDGGAIVATGTRKAYVTKTLKKFSSNEGEQIDCIMDVSPVVGQPEGWKESIIVDADYVYELRRTKKVKVTDSD